MPKLIIELKDGEVLSFACKEAKDAHRAIVLATVYHHIPLTGRDIDIEEVNTMRVEA